MDRRQFLRMGLGLGAGLLLSQLLQNNAEAAEPAFGFDLKTGIRTVDLWRPETRERLQLSYLQDGQWVDNAYPQLCWLLRDFHANEAVQMDPTLIAILDWTQHYLAQFGYTEPLQILSGYRSRRTNAHTEGAARNSQHLYGKAVDFRVPGLPAGYLGRLMAWLSQGGVGIYEKDGFVHVDTGRIRLWRGHLVSRRWHQDLPGVVG
ncbi:sulfate adenylyltransferase [Novimethylophilus kurashikiensis]|uniref:Murein endopeptidase K n=1 Tax=Novimethylophilus kurashikiensis TaxID=1825523 RepID=A0A2R5F962_9PROT|nr:DUF882 domain-containing protein [Novimethylophilus kurashikiensis]GBG14359.1 sulfate adenylyltransferase [Novimethylophilus kurashikiensis]